jgi:hypothetical protein
MKLLAVMLNKTILIGMHQRELQCILEGGREKDLYNLSFLISFFLYFHFSLSILTSSEYATILKKVVGTQIITQPISTTTGDSEDVTTTGGEKTTPPSYCLNENNVTQTILCIPITNMVEMEDGKRRRVGECYTQKDYFDPARYTTDFQWGIKITGSTGRSKEFTMKNKTEENSNKNSDKWSKETLHSCYCFNTIQESTVKDGLFFGIYNVWNTDGDICKGQIGQFVLAKYLFVSAVMLVSVLNVVIQEGAKSIVNFERHSSKTSAAVQQQFKTFFGLLINTGFIILIVNSPFPYAVLGIGEGEGEGEGGDSSGSNTGYSGFEALWYTQVGASIAISMTLDMIVPHGPPIAINCILRPCLRKW